MRHELSLLNARAETSKRNVTLIYFFLYGYSVSFDPQGERFRQDSKLFGIWLLVCNVRRKGESDCNHHNLLIASIRLLIGGLN